MIGKETVEIYQILVYSDLFFGYPKKLYEKQRGGRLMRKGFGWFNLIKVKNKEWVTVLVSSTSSSVPEFRLGSVSLNRSSTFTDRPYLIYRKVCKLFSLIM